MEIKPKYSQKYKKKLVYLTDSFVSLKSYYSFLL